MQKELMGKMIVNDEFWMELALSLAETAESLGEVPVGAVIVRDNRLIASGFNIREFAFDPMGHAEISAIKQATLIHKSWRLQDCTLYVTLEPCTMCAGALVQSRISRVVFGARDPKGGALGSLYSLHEDPRLNHRFEVSEGVLASRCSGILTHFFQKKRRTH
jgi:tRNA(adenine34) deaminase